MKWICIRKCQYNGSIYRVGETIECTEGVTPCHHFKPANEKIEIKGVDRELAEVLSEDSGVDKAKIADLVAVREELTSLGLTYDKRCGITTLRNQLINAKKMRGK